MKTQVWSVHLEKSWHGSLGCHAGGLYPVGLAKIVSNMKPTVENVKKVIADLFPDVEIDERDMTVKEQIADTLKYGFFSIDLSGNDEYESLHVSFSTI